MKRLIASLALSLGLVLANVGTAAAARYWELQMFDPAVTTSRTINIEYKVMSTEAADTFKVELFENGASKAVQNIDTDNGDSGVFSVALPASGTYTYKIDATNIGVGTESESRTVQVVDGPAPTVTTVFVNNAGADGAGGGVAGGQGAGGAAADADGEVAASVANEGQVDTEAATDDNQEGDVLGAENNQEATNNRGRNTAIAVIVAVGAIAASYYWFILRPRNS